MREKALGAGGLFDGTLPNRRCKLYENMRAGLDAHFRLAREHCENLWEEYSELADSNFRQEFAIHTHQRWFEMYLAVTLIRVGHGVSCPKPGPDILLDVNGRCIWIEAVCATSGKLGLPDSIPQQKPGEVVQEPIRQYVLRVRNALEEKQRKFRRYIQKDIVGRGDVAVVAVNVFEIDGLCPYIRNHLLRSLYGFGDPLIRFDPWTRSPMGVGNSSLATVRKSSNNDVDVQPFMDESMKHISAVLASDADAFNPRDRLGDDLVIYPNLTTDYPWPRGMLRLGGEWCFEETGDVWKGAFLGRPQLATSWNLE